MTTDDVPFLDVRALKREGLIYVGQEYLEGVAKITWTSCNFGGQRPWFFCPNMGCDRRVAILYGGEGEFLCRFCLGLTYPSQAEGDMSRAKRRALKARAALGPNFATRPKGIHRETFARLRREYFEAYREYVTLYNERFEKLREHLSPRNLRLLKQMERERLEYHT